MDCTREKKKRKGKGKSVSIHNTKLLYIPVSFRFLFLIRSPFLTTPYHHPTSTLLQITNNQRLDTIHHIASTTQQVPYSKHRIANTMHQQTFTRNGCVYATPKFIHRIRIRYPHSVSKPQSQSQSRSSCSRIPAPFNQSQPSIHLSIHSYPPLLFLSFFFGLLFSLFTLFSLLFSVFTTAR